MARNVFYSFHYANDIFRVSTVRNNWVTKGGQKISGIIDKAEFEKIKLNGKHAVENWIDNQLKETSVTVVLIGEKTLSRPYVQYEINKSLERGNAIIGVKIHNIKCARTQSACISGDLSTVVAYDSHTKENYTIKDLADRIYDYKLDDGYSNLQDWVEKAAKNKGK